MADGSNKLTYGEMAVQRNQVAYALSKSLPESIVAAGIYSKNSVEWALCLQICTAMGLRFSPLNWHLVGDEVAYIVDDCDADIVFFSKEYASNVADMKQKNAEGQSMGLYGWRREWCDVPG
jgi:acyl-CoA synthetase (AMP-forming)/AMP-acid ligase II